MLLNFYCSPTNIFVLFKNFLLKKKNDKRGIVDLSNIDQHLEGSDYPKRVAAKQSLYSETGGYSPEYTTSLMVYLDRA